MDNPDFSSISLKICQRQFFDPDHLVSQIKELNNLNQTDEVGRNLLMMSLVTQQDLLFEQLLNLNFDFNHLDKDGKNFLFYFAQYLRHSKINYDRVFQKPVNIYQQTNKRNDLFVYSLICGNSNLCLYLLKNDFKIDKKNLINKLHSGRLIDFLFSNFGSPILEKLVEKKILLKKDFNSQNFSMEKIKIINFKLYKNLEYFFEVISVKDKINKNIKNNHKINKGKL